MGFINSNSSAPPRPNMRRSSTTFLTAIQTSPSSPSTPLPPSALPLQVIFCCLRIRLPEAGYPRLPTWAVQEHARLRSIAVGRCPDRRGINDTRSDSVDHEKPSGFVRASVTNLYRIDNYWTHLGSKRRSRSPQDRASRHRLAHWTSGDCGSLRS